MYVYDGVNIKDTVKKKYNNEGGLSIKFEYTLVKGKKNDRRISLLHFFHSSLTISSGTSGENVLQGNIF